MATSVRSVDKAAAGYIRHRFVRALSASFVVGAVFSLLAVTVTAVVNAALTGRWAQVAVSPLGVVLVLLLVLLPLMALVGVIGGAIDILHRRIIGVALFALGIICAFVGFSSPFYAVMSWLGEMPEVTTLSQKVEVTWFGVFGVVAALIGYELTRHGWWQMTARTEDYRAMRGWRPPLWRVLTSFRRYLGLPSFLSYVGRKRRLVSLLYFGVATLNLGLLMLLALPVMAGSQSAQSADYNPLIPFSVLGGLLALNVIGAGNFLARIADARATKLYQNVREWDVRPPIIFLRAFDQDDAKLRASGGDAFARWPAGVGRARTLDEILLEHGSPYGPVIAIGDPRDPTPPLGAARVFVEGPGDEWQGVVRGLAGASRAVVMCPNHGEGVQWELDLIAQAGGRLRTIFIASPELDRAATLSLFQRLIPGVPEIDERQLPIAAFEMGGTWRMLTARRLSVETYTAALNTALQALFGMSGVKLERSKRA
ncbi:MAG: hypothetical protein R3C30_00275 [Hyphomonadaceae bacterium]